MRFVDARRLTGPSVLLDRPGVILDIACASGEADDILPSCVSLIRRMLDALEWPGQSVSHLSLKGGVSIAFSAPIDALYAAVEIAEWAWRCCEAQRAGATEPEFDAAVASVRSAAAQESNPQLLALEAAARQHGVSLLWDDDEVSIGHGSSSQTWPARALPWAQDLDWSRYRDVPVGLVTGTNGKTTTARVASHLLRSSGRVAGLSSTDWASVDDEILDRDDWSGPGGARLVLRQPGIDAAILETARGGLLRRGLGVETAEVAAITNLAEDHLGDFGSESMQELLAVKWVVSKAVEQDGCLVLNADDNLLVEKAAHFRGELVWFSLDAANAVVAAHVARGGTAVVLREGNLTRLQGEARETICAARDISITFGGTAVHNIANALAAAAVAERLGLTLAQVRHGLLSLSQDANPGRSNLYEVGGFRVLVDFAHNPQAMRAMLAMASALPAKRRILCFAQAGDRTDEQIRELARSAWSIGLARVMVAELEHYRRGRAPGEVFDIIRDELASCGARDEQVLHYEQESESFDAALEWAQEGDLVIILDLGRRSNIREKLDKQRRS